MTTANKTRKPPTPKKPTPKPQPKLLHPEIKVVKCLKDDALNIEAAKNLLGWQEVDKFDDTCCPEIKQLMGLNVRLANNQTNRPIDVTWIKVLAQEVLQVRWKFNGYTIVIGKFGSVLSGQHRLIALIYAEHLRKKDEAHWNENWTGPCQIETLVCYGVDESDSTFQTLNRERPGTGSDVIFRSPLFADLKPEPRKVASRVTDYAVKTLWERTGAKADAFAPHRTPAETMEFIYDHLSVIKAVKHIVDEDSEGKLSKYVSQGTAAGFMYLMAAQSTDGEAYYTAENKNEKLIKLDAWGKADEFWVLLVGSPEMNEVRTALGMLGDPDTGVGGSRDEKIGIIVKAWRCFSQGYEIKPKDLELTYHTNEEGIRKLIENPTVGGIDRGKPKSKPVKEVEAPTPSDSAAAPKDTTVKVHVPKAKAAKETKDVKDDEVNARLNTIREAHPGKLLLFYVTSKAGADNDLYRAWGGDAVALAKVLGTSVMKGGNGLNYCNFAASESTAVLAKLVADGREVALVRGSMEKPEVAYHEPAVNGKAEKPAKKKPPTPVRKATTQPDLKAQQLKKLEEPMKPF